MRINITSFLFIVVSFIFTPNVFAKEINIYSHRQPFLINPFLELFTQETGIKTNVVYSKKGLAQRLKAEGENSPADVILTVDIDVHCFKICIEYILSLYFMAFLFYVDCSYFD